MTAYDRWYAEEYREPRLLADLKCDRRPKAGPQRTADGDVVEALLASCSTNGLRDRRDEAIIRILECTGMRRGECASLLRAQVDMESGVVVVADTKNGEPRRVRLSANAQRALRRYFKALGDRETNGYLWWGRRGGHLGASGIGQMFDDRSAALGIEVTAHALRRGFAVRWLRMGGSETHLRAVAGWKSPEMVARYTQMLREEEAMATQARLFG